MEMKWKRKIENEKYVTHIMKWNDKQTFSWFLLYETLIKVEKVDVSRCACVHCLFDPIIQDSNENYVTFLENRSTCHKELKHTSLQVQFIHLFVNKILFCNKNNVFDLNTCIWRNG